MGTPGENDGENNGESASELPGEDATPDSRRQIIKRAQRHAGDRSAKVARLLMSIHASTLPKLDMGEDLDEVVTRARATKSLIARRREERCVASALRRIDLPALEERIKNVQTNGVADLRLFQLAESWRERLIAEGPSALVAFRKDYPTAVNVQLEPFIVSAVRERTFGKPLGGARALFRQVIAVMKPPPNRED
jgi:ribosome-associated protein